MPASWAASFMAPLSLVSDAVSGRGVGRPSISARKVAAYWIDSELLTTASIRADVVEEVSGDCVSCSTSARLLTTQIRS
jgi:hypothetical protein